MSMLKDLYNGNIPPFGEREITEEHNSVLVSLSEIEEKIIGLFPEVKNLFEQYQNKQIDVIKITNYDEFSRGFRVGALLMLEMLKPLER